MTNNIAIPTASRHDELLGAGWWWSSTTQWKVLNAEYYLEVKQGSIWLSIRSPNAADSITVGGRDTACPVMKMMLLTHNDELLRGHAEKLKSM